MSMTERSVLCLSSDGFHRMAYTQWGRPTTDGVVLCVHGLTRNSRDFDFLASALERDYCVVCSDMPGRGKSDWLTHAGDYGYPNYMMAITALLARLDVEQVDWVGTSMGGLLGMMLAAQPRSPIRRLVINDIGPFLPKEALQRLAVYVGADPRFATLEELEAYLREIHAPFGPLADAQWRFLAEHGHRQLPEGGFGLHYDPKIGDALRNRPIEDGKLWHVWEKVRCPVLLIRGTESDLLLTDTVAQMCHGRSNIEVVEIPGVGHAPLLASAMEIDAIVRWLAGH